MPHAARRRRRTRRRLPIAALIALALVAGIGVATRRHVHPVAQAALRRARHHVVRLAPPPPIPGYLLIADRGNNRILLVDASKHVYWRYPPPGRPTPMPFRFDDDTFFSPTFDRIISNQEDQHTIQIISFPGGRLEWRYGHVNVRSSAAGYLNTPDDAYLLPNGLVTVADAYNCRVLFINRAHRVVRQYGTTGVCRHNPPTELGAINGATPLADGGTLVSEINGSWVDDIGPNGRLRFAVQAPVSYPSDPQLIGPDRILIADYAHPGHALIMTTRGRVLWRYGPSSGPGELDHPSLAFRIAPGLVAINDDYRDRVVIVDIHTNRIVWQYGHTGRPGTGPDALNTPDGLDLLPTAVAQRLPVLRRLMSARRARIDSPVALRALPYRLPAPVQRAAAVAAGDGVVIAGGLDAAGASTNGVFRLDPASGRVVPLGSVPQPFHDAAAATIGGRLFVFGGGAAASTAAVQSFDFATRRGALAGRLPHALSDVVAAAIGGTVYLVGGYDGAAARAEIYATTDGTHFRVVARLARGVRYPAVAVAGGRLVIAGGSDVGGNPMSGIDAFDPRTGRVARIGSLPAPLAHAAAVAAGRFVYLVGGTGPGGTASRELLRIDPATGGVVHVATVAPVADATVAGRYLIGGSRDGRAIANVSELVSR